METMISSVPAIVTVPASLTAAWVTRIHGVWQQSVEAIIETGRLLQEAKNDLPHGAFLGMVKAELPFGPRTAQALMVVAADERIRNAVSYLPPHWGTLYQMTRLCDEEFDARVLDGTINPDMERNAVASIVKRERRAEREIEFATKVKSFPGQKFGIIYADPPWKLKSWSEETGLERAADQHYPTMAVEEICALSDPDGRHVSDLVAPDEALLLLWITVPFLDRMADIFRAWGPIVSIDPEYGAIRTPWKYVSNYCWDKENPATGRWNRNQHEHLLIARIGNVPAPNPSDRLRSIYREASKEHSRKPEGFAAMIEQIYPDVPKIELFRRGAPRAGWSAWGNQAIQEAA